MKTSKLAMLKTLPAVLISACLIAAAQADEPQPLTPQDFASGIRIEGANSGAPLYRLDLPVNVFSGTAWPDLRDVRVFNNQGEAVPFWMLKPETRPSRMHDAPLHLFPLPAKADAEKGGKVLMRTDRQQIEIELPRDDQGEGKPASVTYLVEARLDIAQPALRRVHFDWPHGDLNWQGRVTILGSNDLSDWSYLAAGTLTDLRTDKESLRIDEIALPTAHPEWKYWLLRVEGNPAPMLTAVSGRYAERPAEATPVTLDMSARRISASEYEYVLPHALPLAALTITLPTDNAIARVEIATRGAAKDAWSPLGISTLYRFTGRGEEQSQGNVDAAGRLVQGVRIVARGAGWGEGAPVVRALVEPRVLVFNARGQAPFLLAWGARAAGAAAMDARDRIPGHDADASILDIPQAWPGAPVKLGGPERLIAQSAAERHAGWQKAALWIVLVAGAGALAWLALRLLREARTTGE
jgi:hypothetical protein